MDKTTEGYDIESPVIDIQSNGAINGNSKVGVFSLQLRYICEDGREVIDTYRRARKRDVAAYLATLPCEPPRPLVALFREDGTFKGTKETFRIGGA